MQQELTKNRSNIDQKSTKLGAKTSPNRSLELSWRVLEGSGRHLGPERHQDTKKESERGPSSPPPRPPRWHQNPSKSVPRANQKVIIFGITFWIDFGTILSECGPNLAPKTEPKSPKYRCKNQSKKRCPSRSTFDALFVDFGAENGVKLGRKWGSKSIVLEKRENQLNTSRLVFSWLSGMEVEIENPSKVDQIIPAKKP